MEPLIPESNPEGPEKRAEEENAPKPFHGSHWRFKAPPGAASPQEGQDRSRPFPAIPPLPAAGREGWQLRAAPSPQRSVAPRSQLPGRCCRPTPPRGEPPSSSCLLPAGRDHSEPLAPPGIAAPNPPAPTWPLSPHGVGTILWSGVPDGLAIPRWRLEIKILSRG